MENQITSLRTAVAGRYASFAMRLVALIIDYILVNTLYVIGFVPILLALGFTPEFFDLFSAQAISDPTLFLGVSVFGGVFSILLFWLYYALMESSKYQATLGKMVVGVKVTDINGNKLSFARASGRAFGRFISSFLFIGFIMAAFSDKRQALHDMMAGTLVVE